MQFIAKCPLALRLNDRIFVCHSIPEKADGGSYDVSVFHRPLSSTDLAAGGGAFQLVWGRDFRPENLAAFARLVSADVVIHGHEPCAQGFAASQPRQIVLDCCSSTACYLFVPLREPVPWKQLPQRIHRLLPAASLPSPNSRSAAPVQSQA